MPTTLEGSFPVLEKLLKPQGVAELRAGGESELAGYHFGLGMWMRNNWNLWHGGPLADWFRARGIVLADDMSGIILTSFCRHVRSEPIRLEEQIEKYRTYWRDQKIDPDTMRKMT